MQLYRAGLVRKAQALKEAVERRLRPPLSELNAMIRPYLPVEVEHECARRLKSAEAIILNHIPKF